MVDKVEPVVLHALRGVEVTGTVAERSADGAIQHAEELRGTKSASAPRTEREKGEKAHVRQFVGVRRASVDRVVLRDLPEAPRPDGGEVAVLLRHETGTCIDGIGPHGVRAAASEISIR